MSMFGLVDGNNFYASVERAFDPRLIGKPILVLSNNDGAVIARSAEAKALGIAMGQPIHEVPPDVRRRCSIRSANFALYGDISGRIVSILRDLFPRVEIYSIDESFITFDGIPDPIAMSRQARARIHRWTGIPCCIGLGPTKTLAKASNKLAKRTLHGVLSITDPARQLADLPIEDVWGVGRRWAARLGAEGVLTAADLLDMDPETLRARYGVTLARTQRELQGIACADLVDHEPDRQQIVVSRSFGRDIDDLDQLQEAVSSFAIRACEKLRHRALVAGGVCVWVHTNPFKPQAHQYHPSRALTLPVATSDTRQVLEAVRSLCTGMFRCGYLYKKAGIALLDLTHEDHHQADLFSSVPPRSPALMQVLDKANRKFGRGAVGFASSGWRKQPAWAMKQAHLSPSYTTRWQDLPKVR